MTIVIVVSVVFLLCCYCSCVEAKICGEVDIRSDIIEFEKLNGCTVIVGSLSILLMEKNRPEDFERYSFPDLTEIKGYFLMYRVFGIRTLSNLFPNLSVIRGQMLFEDFAFVLFELPDLEEVGGSISDVRPFVCLHLSVTLICYVGVGALVIIFVFLAT